MADVMYQVMGGKKEVAEGVETVGELKQKIGKTKLQASVNGDAVDDDYDLEDGDRVTFSEAKKGGL